MSSKGNNEGVDLGSCKESTVVSYGDWINERLNAKGIFYVLYLYLENSACFTDNNVASG